MISPSAVKQQQQINAYLDVELQILPLTEAGVLVTFEKLPKWLPPEMVKDLVDVRLEQIHRYLVLHEVLLHVRHRLLRVFL